MSAMPKQVAQQLKDVEVLEQQLYAQEAPAEPPIEPVAVEPAPAEAPAEPQTPTPEVAPKPEVNWEQKYRTLQGMFDSQVPQLHKQNKELNAQLQTMQAQLDKLAQQPEAAKEQERLVSDKDVETFGEDLLDVQRRIAREVMREHVAPLQAELDKRDARIEQLEKQLHRTGGEVATMSFEQKLQLAVPDFNEINSDPKWIAWLDESDPYTGEPRRIFAEFVYGQGDVEKVKRIVQVFKDATGTAKQDAARAQRQAELERQVTPSRAAGVSAAPSDVRLYTEVEASRLFNKVRELNQKGKYDEASKLEAELSLAYVQGRVRG